MKQPANTKPTEGELEILQVLWQLGTATVRDVHEKINITKPCGYTTTLKLMQIMFEKELVTRDNSQKTHIYKANISKEGTQRQIVGKMIHSLFAGSTSQLVMQALGSRRPSAQELDEIEAMINALKQN